MEKGTIICVDDEEIVLTGLKSQLGRHFEDEYDIETVTSAEEALEIIEDIIEEGEELPLVISDQIMPGMKGDDFLVRTHQIQGKTLKILLTGQADAKAVGNSVNNANLYRYMSKPWEESDLVLTVKEALRSYSKDQELELKNAELEKMNHSLEAKVQERTIQLQSKNKELQEQKDEIVSSITYAKRIQEAVLPSPEYIQEILSENFILFKPQSIVSGDFYWMKKIKNFLIIATADCTGHGVPGAFMSMLGSSFLNEIVTVRSLDSSGQILDKLRAKIKKSLRQRGDVGEQKDGMDIAFYIIDTETLELQFSGAYNPLLIIRKDAKGEPEQISIKADRQPIAVHVIEKEFTTQKVQLQKGDCLYTFSDGFSDQFGGENDRKFKIKNFKKLLTDNYEKPMSQQQQILDDAFENWRGNTPQVDDVLVIGLKIGEY